MKVILIGAGMGGLSAALALQQHGAEVSVYEQASALREVGAGLTLTSGALRSLHSIGLLQDVQRASQPSTDMPFVHYQSARLLWGKFEGPPGDAEADTDASGASGAHAFVARHIFRADLLNTLAAALQARQPGAVKLGHTLLGFSQDDTGVTATFANGHRVRADLLIGADGLHSTVRAALWGAGAPHYTGQVERRFLVDGARAQRFLGSGRAAVFLGPDRTFNRYTLRGGDLLNAVALVRTPGWQGEGWSIPGDPQELAALFSDWHPDVRGLVGLTAQGKAGSLNKWALCSRPALPTWLQGRVAVLGDAAHPMLPFMGLGAAMAIEDAAILGRAWALTKDPLATLERYDAARRPRATAAAEASERQGLLLQGQDPDRFQGSDAPIGNRAFFDYDLAAVML